MGRMPRNQSEPREIDTQRVLLVGCNFASLLCMARSLGVAGYRCDIFRVYGGKLKLRHRLKALRPDEASKYVDNFCTCVLDGDESKLAEGLLAYGKKLDKKRLIIITDDLSTNVIDRYYDKLSPYFLVSNIEGEAGAVAHAMTRAVQKRLAAETGLPTLESWVVNAGARADDLPAEITYPCIAKSNDSTYVDKTLLVPCADAVELAGTLAAYARRGVREVLVERFVPVKRECSLVGAASRAGAVCPGGLEATLGGKGRQQGIAVAGNVIDYARCKRYADAIVAMVESLRYEGTFDADFIEDDQGNLYFTELNLRLGASGYAIVKSGVNVPAMYADYMLHGTPIDTTAQVKAPAPAFVNEKILCTEFTHGGIDKAQVDAALAQDAVFFIRDDDDPDPYDRFKSVFSYAGLLRKLPLSVSV